MISSKLEALIIKLISATSNKEELAAPLVWIENPDHQIVCNTYEMVSAHLYGRWNNRMRVRRSTSFKSIIKKLELIIKDHRELQLTIVQNRYNKYIL